MGAWISVIPFPILCPGDSIGADPTPDSDPLPNDTEIDVKTLLLPSIALLLAADGLSAQGASQEDLKKLYDTKVSENWFTGGEWTADFSVAKARAKKEGKLVFAYFTRSYSP